MDFLFSYDLILSFFILTFLEIILGIDNLIFIAIVAENLPKEERNKTRYIGISLALIIESYSLIIIVCYLIYD